MVEVTLKDGKVLKVEKGTFRFRKDYNHKSIWSWNPNVWFGKNNLWFSEK